MHLSTSTLLFLLPLALSAPAPPSDVQGRSVGFIAGHNAPRANPRAPSPHSSNVEKVKRTVQVKVRRPLPPGSKGKRACAVNTSTSTVTSSSAAVPAATASANSTTAAAAGTGAALVAVSDAVFPLAATNEWSTVSGRSGALSFNDALKPLTAGKLPPAINAPDGSAALQASYPANTVKYSSTTGHGFSFYTEGLHNNVDVTFATEVEFSYAIYFSDNFDFVKGGKLPGLYGGTSLDNAKSCSGGRQDDRDSCFSARMMWRTNGMGELYNYFPTNGKQPDGYCSIAPKSVCDADYGDSIGRGSFTFPTSQWTTVTQRLRINSPASASNGEQELYVNGKSVLKVTGLQIRTNDATKIYGIMAQTFFGGSDQTWASPKDQWAWFKDWSLGVVY